MLKVIVFVCGAALMALEIVAARVLAPALGNSIYVWGSVISIVMIALSVGYWAGGQIADHDYAAWALGPIIAAGGVLTVIAPLVAKAILVWAAGFGAANGSLVASTLIFFLPAFMLAMISPLGVRLATQRGIEHVGRSAGGLYAISTGGSIIGTLATSFWLIPVLSLEPLIVAIGFTLFACALGALFLPRWHAPEPDPKAKKKPGAAEQHKLITTATLGATLALVALGLALGIWVLIQVDASRKVNQYGENVIYQADSEYHRISVTETGTIQYLRFDKSAQSAISTTDGVTSVSQYPNYMDLALAVNPKAKHALVLGLGAGAITKRWLRDYPDMTVDAVEIDPAVIDVAKRYFGLPTDNPRLHLYNEDGRRFIQTTSNRYDIVIVDCYYSDSLPFHLATQDFFTELKGRLNPGGVLGYNCVGSVTGPDSRLFRSMYETVASVWPRTFVFPIDIGTDTSADPRGALRNIAVFATDGQVSNDQLAANITTAVDGRVKVAGYKEFLRDFYIAPIQTSDVPLLTDSHAPIDSLIKVL